MGVMNKVLHQECPPNDWVKLNTDGYSKGNLGKARRGGLIRDANGIQKGGFTLYTGICNALEVELQAVFQGLNLVWKKGYRKVKLEVDSTLVKEWLSEDSRVLQQSNLVYVCRQLLEREWTVEINHVYRECNQATDFLINVRVQQNEGLVEHVMTPAGLANILLSDQLGVPWVR